MKVKLKDCGADLRPLSACCACFCCRQYSRAALHAMFRANNALAAQLVTRHNVAYMMTLMRDMRAAIVQGRPAFVAFVLRFLRAMFPAPAAAPVPEWAVEALASVDIAVPAAWGDDGSDSSSDSSSGDGDGDGASAEEVLSCAEGNGSPKKKRKGSN